MPSAPQFSTTLTLTSSGESLAFTSRGQGFNANWIRVANDGPKPCYLTFNSSVATTADGQLSSGETMVADKLVSNVMGVIASSSGGSVRILALG